MKILILGASGMLGHSLFNYFSRDNRFQTYATLRSASSLKYFNGGFKDNIFTNIDCVKEDDLIEIFSLLRPEAVINCVGIVKQLNQSADPLKSLPINSMLPHRLANLCNLTSCRLIHISTDCVFSGRFGNYTEDMPPDPVDVYGRSKLLGEVDRLNCVTMRTSMIGHEIYSRKGLVEWFLSQAGPIKGYTNAIFTGFPTIELANIIANYVLPDKSINGIYHVASQPISKFDLLKLIAEIYQKTIEIIPDETSLIINRSLNANKFNEQTGYSPPEWIELITKMKDIK